MSWREFQGSCFVAGHSRYYFLPSLSRRSRLWNFKNARPAASRFHVRCILLSTVPNGAGVHCTYACSATRRKIEYGCSGHSPFEKPRGRYSCRVRHAFCMCANVVYSDRKFLERVPFLTLPRETIAHAAMTVINSRCLSNHNASSRDDKEV